MMKKIEAVIRASDLDNVKAGLAEVVDGPLIASETVCCGPSVQEVRVYRGASYICDAVPCVWLHFVVGEEILRSALDVLRPALQHGPGREIGVLVSDVERFRVLTDSPGDGDGHGVPHEAVRTVAAERSGAFALPGWIGSPAQSAG